MAGIDVTVDLCCSCGNPFTKGPKGYQRVSVASLTSPATAGKLFPGISKDSHVFICLNCQKVLRQKTKVKRAGKKKRTWSERATPMKYFRRPLSSPDKSSPAKKKSRTTSVGNMTRKACNYLQNNSYLLAFRTLLHRGSESVKRAYVKVFCELLIQEKKRLLSRDIFPVSVSEKSISAFSWEDTVDRAADVSPSITACLKSLLPDSKHISRKTSGPISNRRSITDQDCTDVINRRLGVILAVILYSMKPARHKFFQACMGVQLWRQGCPHKMFQTLHELGLSQGVDAARGHVDRLRLGHNNDIFRWKEHVQNYTAAKTSSCKRQLFQKPDKEDGYTVCWDNVQVLSHRKHQSSSNESQFLLWGMCFGAKNRVNMGEPLAVQENLQAQQIDPYCFVPSPDDFQELKEHMGVLVQRILVNHLSQLSTMRKSVQWHIPHQFSTEMCEQTHVVNLGVVEANPSSTSGCIEIMSHLNQYVPVLDGKVHPILCNGDGLSVERMVGAHRARANGGTEIARLEGLVESPQEFHKEILLMQEMMNTFFSGASEASRGTLSQMKNFFRHKSLKKDVKANVQHVWDMLHFTTDAYVVLCAMTILGMAEPTDMPDTFPLDGSDEVKKQWLQSISQKVVDFAWLAPDKEDIRRVAEAVTFDDDTNTAAFPFCSCGEDKDDAMVQCCSSLCRISWSHLSCAQLENPPAEDEDWFCSPECESDGSYVYCICQTRRGGCMIQCQLGPDCKKYEWYHVACVNRENSDTEEVWYCSEDCALGSEHDDSVQNHSKALMWAGLNLLCRRDAVREGNGNQIVSHWKQDMLTFWTKKHYKYFIIGHQFLAGIAGYLPERLAFDLKWNRLANLHGRQASNIGLDLVNELLNNDFKEMMKHSHGKYTPKQVDRCAQMGGAFGKKIDRIFTASGLGSFETASRTNKTSYTEDVALFTTEFSDDALFDYCPVRHHSGFGDFHLESASRIAKPEHMGKKLAFLSTQLDLWRGITEDQGAQVMDFD